MNSTSLIAPALARSRFDAEPDHQAAGRADATDYQSLSGTELLLILGFWSLIALMTAANSLHRAEPRPWQPLVPYAYVLVDLANAFMWAAITPVIFWFASRFAIERTGWPTRVLFVVIGMVLRL